MPYVKKTFELAIAQKINAFLVSALDLPANVVSRLIDKGKVSLNGKVVTAKGLSASGHLEVFYRAAEPNVMEPIFSTDDFCVFDKPSGLLVHQNGLTAERTLLDDATYLYGANAHLVHRLDRQTSGLVMVSKHRRADAALKELFRNRLVEKIYLALVRGRVEKEQLISAPILTGQNRPPMQGVPRVLGAVSANGLSARTMLYPLRFFPDLNASLVKCRLITGRTHQIRLHLAHIGHPVLGDPFYGVSLETANEYLDTQMSAERLLELTGAKRLMLHSYSVEFCYKNLFFIKSSDDFLRRDFLESFLR